MNILPDDAAVAGDVSSPTLNPRARSRFALTGLWRHRDFMRLWTGQTVSQFGSTITREALPYTAILALHATPLQMGILGAARAAPVLLLGLLAGVWVDRMRRRPLMIAADLGRALVLLWVPLAYLLGVLQIEQLYVVAALIGVFSLFFDVAYQSFLPSLVQRDQIMEGNSKLGVSASIAEVGGPPLGGALVQLISGPLTILLDAISFVFSALMLWGIARTEPAPAPATEQPHIWRDLAAGLRTIWRDPALRAMAGASAIGNFFGWFFGAVYGLYALDVLGLNTATLGALIACGGGGALAGALLVGRVNQRFGVGPTIVGAWLITSSTAWLIWLAGGAVFAVMPLMILAQLVGDAAGSMATINMLSLRQSSTARQLLGRVNASMNVLSEGIGTLGLLVGGALAEKIGLRPTVLVIACGLLLGSAWIFCSPLRHVRELPAEAEENS